MGSRGPLRDPLSRRGAVELPNFAVEAPEKPSVPVWLNKSAGAIFQQLVDDLIAARVPVKRVDGHAIAMTAYCLESAQSWAGREKRAKTPEAIEAAASFSARFQRDAQKWLDMICASPQARARIGLRATPEKNKQSTVAGILELKRQRSAG